MNSKLAQYKTSIFRVGILADTDLVTGQKFEHPDGYDFAPGVGSRVNLMIRDGISTASRTNPTLTAFGISVGWSFQGRMQPERPVSGSPPLPSSVRILDNGIEPAPGDDIRSAWFQEPKIIFSGSDLQQGELDYHYYGLTRANGFFGFAGPGPQTGASDGNTHRTIPLVARGDFMRVFFYATGPLFSGFTTADRIDIWAIAGNDADGSEKI